MNIMKRRGWEIAESQVTSEHLFVNRRSVLAGAAGLGTIGLATMAASQSALAQGTSPVAPPAGAPPAAAPVSSLARNPKYQAGRALTEEKFATTYNNYYEFGESKNVWREAQKLKQRPWAIQIDGMVKQARTLDIDDLLKQVQVEERVYRHRCVEAWAMTVPWMGFPLSQLVALAEPLSAAKYLVFETAQDKAAMKGLASPFYSWPYVEGLALDEAMNDLAFLSTGLYGKPMPPQNGGPIRLTVPWKYGFKGAKSIARITFTDKRPKTFWEGLQSREYGFWANVNPAVSHPRWSQSRERLLGDDEMVPTQIYNGYGDFVAGLYTDRKSEKAVYVIAQRTLAVLAAAMLVCAAALAMIGPRSVSLGRVLANWGVGVDETLKGWVLGVFGPWVWTDFVMPLLVRPAWLLPASLGIVFAGLSMTLAYRNTASRSHRRS